MKSKQIVIDKDAFIGIDISTLCKFAKRHFLILPEVLIYECMTSDNMKERKLIQRCKTLIVSGAYYCPRSVTYLKWEAKNASPYPWFLADLEKTNLIRRENSIRQEHTFDIKELQEVYNLHYEVANGILSGTSSNLKSKMNLERPDIIQRIKKMSQNTMCRFTEWFENIDRFNMHNTAVTKLPEKFIKDKVNFCLSVEWITWQYFRIITVLVDDYYYRSETGGSPKNEKIEHDFQDMEYVLLLCRADGLLTRDEKMVKPLAKAAFPDKDVFSSLDEVPEDYKYDWA